MPVLAEAPKTISDVERKRWTRDEWLLISAAGLHELEQYELIGGDLIRKAPKSMAHSIAQALLSRCLSPVFGFFCVVPATSLTLSSQDSQTSFPDIDLAVLRRSIGEINSEFISSSDLHIAVEVSDTTLNFDRTIKAALYARSAIPEYWVVDTNARRLIVHREPQDGSYQSILTYAEDESISPLAAPTTSLPVSNIFQERTN